MQTKINKQKSNLLDLTLCLFIIVKSTLTLIDNFRQHEGLSLQTNM